MESSIAVTQEDGARHQPKVVQTAEHLYQIEELVFNAKTRTVHLPVTVNMSEAKPIEYLLVHEQGKVHESIFTTPVSPLSLNIALKLLKFQKGDGTVFAPLLPPEAITQQGSAPCGDSVEVSFLLDEQSLPQPCHNLILDRQTEKSIQHVPWIYTGSRIENGTFMAESIGSIIAIYLDPLAMFNTTAQGADDDERWIPNTSNLPPKGTPGTLILSISKDETPPSQTAP